MATQTLVRRLDSLEGRVEILEMLPERMDRLELQIAQFREEVRGEFLAVRSEMRLLNDETTAELRAEIKAGDEETRHLMRILHEDVITRLTIIQDGQRPQPPRSDVRKSRRRSK